MRIFGLGVGVFVIQECRRDKIERKTKRPLKQATAVAYRKSASFPPRTTLETAGAHTIREGEPPAPSLAGRLERRKQKKTSPSARAIVHRCVRVCVCAHFFLSSIVEREISENAVYPRVNVKCCVCAVKRETKGRGSTQRCEGVYAGSAGVCPNLLPLLV